MIVDAKGSGSNFEINVIAGDAEHAIVLAREYVTSDRDSDDGREQRVKYVMNVKMGKALHVA